MFIIGDVLAIIALAAGGFATVWGVLIGISFIFPDRASMAAQQVQAHPFRSIFLGLLGVLVIGFFALVFTQAAFPLLKLIGLALYMGLLGFGLVGISGLVKILASRIAAHDPKLTSYGATSRAAMLLVAGSLVPLVGWFLIAPLLLVLGVGVGLQSMRGQARSTAPASDYAPPVL